MFWIGVWERSSEKGDSQSRWKAVVVQNDNGRLSRRRCGEKERLSAYFFFARGQVYQVVVLVASAQLHECLQQADHAGPGIVAAQPVKPPLAVQHGGERQFAPSVHGLHGVYVRVEQQGRLVQVECRAEAPHVVAFPPGGHALHFDVLLQAVGRTRFVAAYRWDGDELLQEFHRFGGEHGGVVMHNVGYEMPPASPLQGLLAVRTWIICGKHTYIFLLLFVL